MICARKILGELPSTCITCTCCCINCWFAYRLLHDGVPELIAFQGALRDCVLSIDATYGKEVEELHIGLEGSFGSKHVTPRSLSAAHLGSMVCVEGIITKC